HTRFKCDWSSDVCSSDLAAFAAAGVVEPVHLRLGNLRRGGEGVLDPLRGPLPRPPVEEGLRLVAGGAGLREVIDGAGVRAAGGEIGRASCRGGGSGWGGA